MFHWQGDITNTVGLIGDSICKWVQGMPHLENQSVPGLTLDKLCSMLSADGFKTAPFHAILIHCGTNDVAENSPEAVGQMMENVLELLSAKVPGTRLAVSMVIPRPKDDVTRDEKRRKVNTELKRVCKRRGITFMQSYKGVTVQRPFETQRYEQEGMAAATQRVFEPALYARDKLHLKLEGIQCMKRYLRGAVATLMEDLPKL
jgi:hypothetical protein